MQMKWRTRERAIMKTFALASWEREVPEEFSRTEKLSSRIELSLLLMLCHFMLDKPFPPSRHKELSPGPPKSLWKSRVTDLTVVLEGDSIFWMMAERLSPQQYWLEDPNSHSAVDFTRFSTLGYLWKYLHCFCWISVQCMTIMALSDV